MKYVVDLNYLPPSLSFSLILSLPLMFTYIYSFVLFLKNCKIFSGWGLVCSVKKEIDMNPHDKKGADISGV